MEWHGSERASSSQAEQNSLLDVPWVVTPESFLLNPNPGKDDAVDVPLSPVADTGIHSAPVENDDHTGEMITRCIVEILLNSLSKANAPLINPQCKELLKKSDQQKQKEQNIHQGIEFDTRTLSESEELSKQSEGTVKEQENVSEEFKRQSGGAEWHLEAKKHGGSSNQQIASQETYALEGAHKEEKKNENGKGTEEDNYKRNLNNGEGGKEKKASEEVESGPREKKSVLKSGKVNEDDYKHSLGQKYMEEIIQSQERENEDSKEEEEEEEEKEEAEESNEKYHHSFHEEFEESSERENGETEKQDHKSGHYRRKPRPGKSFEYKNHHNGEKKDSPEELSEEESEFSDKRSHHPNHYYERGHYFVEPRNSIERHRSEEMERESRSKGYWDQHYPSQDNDEDMNHHSRENEKKQYQNMRKRLLGGPSREVSHHYEVRMPYSKVKEENGGKKQSHDSIDEKRHLDQPSVQLKEMPNPQNKEREDGEQGLNGQEAKEEKHYLSIGEGKLETTHHSERGKHSDNKRTVLLEEGYPRSHYLVENVKRALNLYYYQQPRWKDRSVDKNDDTIDPLLESEEERKSHLNKREFFPKYDDYDLWEKQILDGLNHKQDNNNNPERLYKPKVKKQYDRMDQLAHLLSYRKKSAEFPQLYSSKEDTERGHIIRSDKGKFNQRSLTPEEEKELENLAAMDLELQKIAEKFNNNQRG